MGVRPERWAVVFLVVAGLATAGCGYALAGRGSSLPSHIKTIAVPPFENKSPVFGVEKPFTDKVRNEIIGRGKYFVPDATGGDALLLGTVVSMTYQPSGVNEQQRGTRYVITVVLSVSLKEPNGNVLWSNDALTFRDEYEFTSRSAVQGATFVDQERTVLERMSSDVARTVVTAIMEAF